MSEKLINRSSDLKRLRDEGYEVEVRQGYLIVHSVPYVNDQRVVAHGTVSTNLKLNDDQTQKPEDHQVWFSGDFPCQMDGSPISAIRHSSQAQTLCEGLVVQHRFSNKPKEGYPDYYAKMTRYIEIISGPATELDPKATARTFKPVLSTDLDSVFRYTDSASSRAGITNLANKLRLEKIAIIGLGGTGSYVLDLVAKTPVKEIHLFDGDEFLQHNAFRAPGAAPLAALEEKVPKVEYFSRMYEVMRLGIVPHAVYVTDENVSQLADVDFVFVCVDKPSVRKFLYEFFKLNSIPFVDTGLELELIEETQNLVGTCRVTSATQGRFEHFPTHVSLESGQVDDLYATNVQVADLNALCAVMAVIRWKKWCGFYQDCYGELQSAYALNAHQLTREEVIPDNFI
ncbi:MAG: ThiF family adenylyltransferase [Candidatus Berkelbacteria bacterium]|nr:ThiF family adenylyltransferase [Candidatus Berkelbacteria bacterium]